MRGRKHPFLFKLTPLTLYIKKESPNEGTETLSAFCRIETYEYDKKRIPEWGDGNTDFFLLFNRNFRTIKKESPNEGTETSFRIYIKI